MQEGQIYYKQRTEIDDAKWNECITNADNGLIYAYSFYLDGMADNWDALVLNDYEAVMPLPWRRKMGIYYLYQPFLTPQLGIIGRNAKKELPEAFLKYVPKKFSFWEINLNTGNILDTTCFKAVLCKNYFIRLTNTYEDIAKHYNQNLKRNIKKAVSHECVYNEKTPIQEVLDLSIMHLRQYTHFTSTDIAKFKSVVEVLVMQEKAQIAGVYHNDILCAASVFLLDNNTAYYILATTTSTGKTIGASHFLLSEFIKRHIGKFRLLDLAGSDVPSIAQFYKGFGAKLRFYCSIRLNNLHPLIRWIKN